MTLFVKNTDTAIIGISATQEVVWLVHGLADDGLPILGEISPSDELPEMEIRDNAVRYVTAEGDTYPDHQIEDRREDGSTVSARPMPSARPLTRNILSIWKRTVWQGGTQASFRDWVEGLTDREYLAHHGLHLRERDWRINRAFEGSWQLTEYYADGTTTENAANGPWAIVGDDKGSLVAEAYSHLLAAYPLVD